MQLQRGWLAGLIGGLLGLGLALLGDAVDVYRGLWVYAGLLPGVAAAVGFGPVAGLLAGLITGAAGGSPFVSVAVGLWMALVGWLGARRWPGLMVALSVPLVLAPLVAVGYARFDLQQVWPLAQTLGLLYLPTALALGLLVWVGRAVWRRFGRRAVATAAALGIALIPFPGFGEVAPPPPGAVLRAGFAQADISPSQEMLAQGIHMGGYGGRSGPAEGVHDPLYFRVLAVEEGGARVLFVQLDTVGMGNRLYGRLKEAAAASAGTEHVLIGATHTHAGPDLQGLWGGVPEAYEEFLVSQLSLAASEAVAKLEPVELRSGTARLQITRNRRDWGAVPEELNVLQAVAPGGRVVGTLVNFAAHPTVMPRENMLLSTDFVGPMLAAVGGPALFFNGAQGDVLPADVSGEGFARAEAFGHRVAEGVKAALASARPVKVDLSARTIAAHAPLENWQLGAAMALGIVRYDVSHAGVVPGVRTHVSLVRLAPEVTLVTAPGEMMTRLWDRIGKQFPAGQRFILGLTHDSLGYIIPEDEWMTGRNRNYEESVSLGPAMAGVVESALDKLLH